MKKSSYNPSDEGDLRVSKSSLITYMKCPRQFYWNYVSGVPRPPPSEEMIRGTAIHSVLEAGLLEGEEAMNIISQQLNVEGDPALIRMVDLVHQIAAYLGGLDLVEAEAKHEVNENYQGYDVVWVGMIDGVIRNPDGTLTIVELKTGTANIGKINRTRKEMVYYLRLLGLMDYAEVTHFLYILPDYEKDETILDCKLLAEGNKRNKVVFQGKYGGYALMEQVSSRSIKAFDKSLSSTIESLVAQQWPMKWNDYFCPIWCDFNLNCEAELTGYAESTI